MKFFRPPYLYHFLYSLHSTNIFASLYQCTTISPLNCWLHFVTFQSILLLLLALYCTSFLHNFLTRACSLEHTEALYKNMHLEFSLHQIPHGRLFITCQFHVNPMREKVCVLKIIFFFFIAIRLWELIQVKWLSLSYAPNLRAG